MLNRPEGQQYDLQAELDGIADFGSLSARKAYTRLQLFQTPACCNLGLFDHLSVNQVQTVGEVRLVHNTEEQLGIWSHLKQ